jgi:hydrogenase maturation protein HypF
VIEALHIIVRGTVQGVGFRPFVARLAEAYRLTGWVRNADRGVEIHVEGLRAAIDAFAHGIQSEAPPAACVVAIDAEDTATTGLDRFLIRDSERRGTPTVRMSVDLPVCDQCLEEMLDERSRRFEYPYITCTNCGPRFSLLYALPYDRQRTTMAAWSLCSDCRAEYHDVRDRRFHAESIACWACGPQYALIAGSDERHEGRAAFTVAAGLLRSGAIVAMKGVGGYHLSCDASSPTAIRLLRDRKYRKSKPFALMARDTHVARALVDLQPMAEVLLTSDARPIVLMPARVALPDVAANHRELGVMLPYAPIHHLLFRAGAPDVLVMTSANRSSEPIAYEDADARTRLEGIADAFLVGDRPIARRIDDSVVRLGPSGPLILRRARGYAPGVVARLPARRPILAVGADLKNTIAMVVGGEVVVSQHIGDLEHLPAREAFQATIRDLVAMYELKWADVIVAHDRHPEYASTSHALGIQAHSHVAVQHHRAHIASVLAERAALDTPVVGVAFDGTGYGDDQSIWGGEVFVGSVIGGLSRAASLQPFVLPGGDAAARSPMQAAAGALCTVADVPDLTAPPFCFTTKYTRATQLVEKRLRTFDCTSAGRLFDAAAAILGFTRDVEYEGQAAEWVEQLAWQSHGCDPLPFEVTDTRISFGPALRRMLERRMAGEDVAVTARAFHEGLANAIGEMVTRLCDRWRITTAVLSGGTFQNALLEAMVRAQLPASLTVWTNREVPPNDGGISLGQAAIASVARQ